MNATITRPLSRTSALPEKTSFPVKPYAPMLSPLAEFKQAAIAKTLQNCRLFSGPLGVDLRQIAAVTVVKSLGKGDYLCYEGAPVHGFFVVQKGAVKLHRFNLSGKEQVIHVARPYESFAEEALVSNSGYLASAAATEPSRVLMIPKAEFAGLLHRHPELAMRVLRSVGQQVRFLLGLLEDLTLNDVQTRLANWLVQHCPNPESNDPWTIELPMTKRMLASELGTVSETFSRTLAKLRDQKLLTIDRNAVTVVCPAKLVGWLRSTLGMALPSSPVQAWNAPAWRGGSDDAGYFSENAKGLAATA